MKFVIDLSADELEKLASIANKKNESMHKTGADVIREFISRPTQYAPDVANAAPEEEALRILNDCIAKLQGVTRHAGNT